MFAVAAALLLTSTIVQAESFPHIVPAGRAFDLAARTQFGAGAFKPWRLCGRTGTELCP
jgi:hypothetical protein